MKIIAYLRVSTNSQDLANQKLAIHEYAHNKGITITEFIQVKVSSRKRIAKHYIDEIISKLDSGDMLIVSELSRLGRSLGYIIQILDTLVKQNIRFVAIKEAIDFSGKQDMKTKVMVTLFGLFAEVERDLISERTKAGLAAARMKGKLLGRPKGTLGKSRLDGKENEIQLLMNKKVSLTSIARIMDISKTALYNFIDSRKLKRHLVS